MFFFFVCVCVCVLVCFVLCFAEQSRFKLRFECKPKCVLTVQIFFSSEQLFLEQISEIYFRASLKLIQKTLSQVIPYDRLHFKKDLIQPDETLASIHFLSKLKPNDRLHRIPC